MSPALARVRALRTRPWWVPTLLLLLAVAVLALRVALCAALIVVDAAERCDTLARAALSQLVGGVP